MAGQRIFVKISGSASAVKKPCHFEVRKSSSHAGQVTQSPGRREGFA